ncbi:DUF6705 family protein [Chryseobacterium sp. M5]|uniref:DUF6705 family protein n=1 Tax=Chryseobacterium sp. M5 TaxID=3379128 RepID=UPI003857E116
MKRIYSIIIITLFNISCMAQTVSLETMAQCSNNPETCPNSTYVKDVNNLLNKYVGTWIGTLNGKNYEFNFVKKENTGEVIKWDFLVGRLKITNSNGIVEYNSFNKPENELSEGYNFQPDLKVYLMRFSGGKLGCIDYGYTYMWIKPETPNVMGINFHPDNDIVTEDCSNFITTLPDNQIIRLIKQ